MRKTGRKWGRRERSRRGNGGMNRGMKSDKYAGNGGDEDEIYLVLCRHFPLGLLGDPVVVILLAFRRSKLLPQIRNFLHKPNLWLQWGSYFLHL